MTSTVPHQAIYRRWRAQTFEQIVGQEAVVATLRNAVRADRVSHAILFAGPRGTGKTSLARILAKAVNCTDLRDGDACDACPSCVSIREGTTLDVIEIDAASNRKIDDIRELRERLPYPPGVLKRKVYILDEAHQITNDAWNALLKSIEEPPDFVIFMFASTEPSGFPPAIRSRLQRYDVRRLTVAEIEGKLRRILAADGREADDSAIRLIARLAAGGMRDAESMLDQLLSAGSDRIVEAHVRDLLGLADADVVDQFVDLLVRGDAAAGVALLEALDERGRDVRALLDQVVDAIRLDLVAALGDPTRARHDASDLASAGRRIAAIDPGSGGIGGLRFQLELALFRSAAQRAAPASTSEPAMSAASSGPSEPAISTQAGRVVAAEPGSGSTPSAAAGRNAPRTLAARPATPDPASEAEIRGRANPAPIAARPGPASGPNELAAAPSGALKSPPRAVQPPSATSPSATATPSTGFAERPAPKAPTSASPELDELLAAWPAIVAQLSLHPPTKPLITACRPVAVDGAMVTLGFPEEQAFLRDAAERRRAGIEAGIASALGRPIAVRCVVANIEVVVANLVGAAFVLAEARRIFADDLIDVGDVS